MPADLHRQHHMEKSWKGAQVGNQDLLLPCGLHRGNGLSLA